MKTKTEVVAELAEKGHYDLAQQVVGQKGGSWPYDKVITISDGGLSGRHQGPGMENASVIGHNKDDDKWYLIDMSMSGPGGGGQAALLSSSDLNAAKKYVGELKGILGKIKL
jgi:hypothetical protein